jgi:hypothetical protein
MSDGVRNFGLLMPADSLGKRVDCYVKTGGSEMSAAHSSKHGICSQPNTLGVQRGIDFGVVATGGRRGR